MNILYLSAHSILEHDEIKLFSEMGHDVFSVNGSYSNPNSPIDNKRPPIKAFYSDQLNSVALQCSKENLHPELIQWADLIYVMHRPDWIINNWGKFNGKKVLWRTIGQSVPDIEIQLNVPRAEGLKIVRYSPEEARIGNYIGHDAIIRFYKDPLVFGGYKGNIPAVMTVAQSMKARTDQSGREYCHYSIFEEVTKGFTRVIFGPGNEDTGISGGLLDYDTLAEVYRGHRVYFYTGTYPASYTLNFIEAMMTGIPIVAIGPKLSNLNIFPQGDAYEVDKIIKNGVNGYVSDDPAELRSYVDALLQNPELCKKLGDAGRETAIELFGKDKIQAEWTNFFTHI